MSITVAVCDPGYGGRRCKRCPGRRNYNPGNRGILACKTCPRKVAKYANDKKSGCGGFESVLESQVRRARGTTWSNLVKQTRSSAVKTHCAQVRPSSMRQTKSLCTLAIVLSWRLMMWCSHALLFLQNATTLEQFGPTGGVLTNSRHARAT